MYFALVYISVWMRGAMDPRAGSRIGVVISFIIISSHGP